MRVTPGITPSTGWGRVTPDSVGLVMEVSADGRRCKVDFEGHKAWNGVVRELQVVG